ncbi:MAG: hypothetical protein ACFCVK_26075 [Acidimicrobiales bacterium]
MSGLLDGVVDQPGPGGVARIARGLGADEGAVGSAIAAAHPAILDADGDGSIIDDVIGKLTGC